jgi:hypothetical protein
MAYNLWKTVPIGGEVDEILYLVAQHLFFKFLVRAFVEVIAFKCPEISVSARRPD